MTNAFRRTAERRNKRVWWPLSPTEMSAKRVPFRLIAPLYEKLTAYLAKKWTFATPGPSRTPQKMKRKKIPSCGCPGMFQKASSVPLLPYLTRRFAQCYAVLLGRTIRPLRSRRVSSDVSWTRQQPLLSQIETVLSI